MLVINYVIICVFANRLFVLLFTKFKDTNCWSDLTCYDAVYLLILNLPNSFISFKSLLYF